ncbi:hypothetical protein ACH5RR_029841 [Cinchona calisaya]|uniref:Uncharacterized protein n=1 Tax=Cinchona calisaya TaxID=153742 RepID=A0ABD2YSU0_9GENT
MVASSSKGWSGPVLSLSEFQGKDTGYFHQSNFVEDLVTSGSDIAEIGHIGAHCPAKPKEKAMWIPKKVTQEDNPVGRKKNNEIQKPAVTSSDTAEEAVSDINPFTALVDATVLTNRSNLGSQKVEKVGVEMDRIKGSGGRDKPLEMSP